MSNLDIFYLKNKYPRLYNFFFKLPGVLVILIVFLISMGYYFVINSKDNFSWQVVCVAIIMLTIFIWWIIKGLEYLIMSFVAIFFVSKSQKTNYNEILFGKPKTKYEKKLFLQLPKDKKPYDIWHWVSIPTYNEGYEILFSTLQALKNSEYDSKKILVSIHAEGAKKDQFFDYIEKLKKDFEGVFGLLDYTLHFLQPGEVVGKGANIKFGAKNILEKILTFSPDPSNILNTTLDADNNVDKNYFSVLTYTYLITKDRKHKAYQPMIYFFNNFWESPFFSQLLALQNTLWVAFNSTKDLGVKNFSSHAQSVDALIELDFRSNQTIVEDGHQYWRSYFGFLGNYEVVPVYAKIFHDATMNTNFFTTAQAQYSQMRRWSHGSEDLAYIVSAWKDNFSKMPFWRTLYEFFKHLDGTINWSTMHIIIFFGIILTLVKDIKFSGYMGLGHTISIAMILTSIFSYLLGAMIFFILPWSELKNNFSKILNFIKFFLSYIFLFGIVLFVFSGIPALHTQLSFLFGKQIKVFNVTDKIRK